MQTSINWDIHEPKLQKHLVIPQDPQGPSNITVFELQCLKWHAQQIVQGAGYVAA
jgi:hypothetical protein